MIKAPKKLIEVSIPLASINAAAAREKNNPFLSKHPRSIHTWWARRPFTAARAVLFAQLVNDPGGQRGWDSRRGITKEKARLERERLFKIIEDLVQWENTTNEEVLGAARREIERSWRETCEMNRGEPGFDPEKMPAFHDPFAGGGAIPLEAQRLGLEAHASDLNPVAVAIEKAMIEIPPRFAGRAPIGPDAVNAKDAKKNVKPAKDELGLFANTSAYPRLRAENGEWPGATGLAEDVRRYGAWMCDEAKQRIGHLYPEVEITREMVAARPDLKPYVGRKLTVIAWLWARTVKSPHPAFADCDVPLVSSFILSSKKGKEVWLEPVVNGKTWRFRVRTGTPPQGAENGTKLGSKTANFRCLVSGATIEGGYIKSEGRAGRMGSRLMAVVLEGNRSRVYVEAQPGMEELAKSEKPNWRPSGNVPRHLTGGTCVPYGLDEWHKLFTDRQLVALNCFLDLVQEARAKVLADAKTAFWADDGIRLADGGSGPTAYADAVATYCALAVSRWTDFMNSCCGWNVTNENLRVLFNRQAIPMSWDYAETNPLGSMGTFQSCLENVYESFQSLAPETAGFAFQADAQNQEVSEGKIISTDPPYYDNIAYADLSDFFYAWLRRGLRNIYPSLFATVETPKDEELVASPYRHGDAQQAEAFFMDGMTATLKNLARHATPAFPVTIYYAYKQSKTGDSGTSNAGWETFLEAVIQAGFEITRTWPMRTEKQGRSISNGTNALASSIVLVCRKRPTDAKSCQRREFLKLLRERMPDALEEMEGGEGRTAQVSPVDRPQAVIGPGMEVFSSFSEVLNADGSRMGAGDAIREINRFLDPEGGFDPETQFCLDWFRARGWDEGPSGDAITMAQGQGLAVSSVVDAGVLRSRGGKTALIHWRDYPQDYDPERDAHRPAWEVLHHLVRIHQKRGSGAAGAFLSLVQEQGEAARRLAYRLYTLCERKGLAEDARPYNELAGAWEDVSSAAARAAAAAPKKQEQLELGL